MAETFKQIHFTLNPTAVYKLKWSFWGCVAADIIYGREPKCQKVLWLYNMHNLQVRLKKITDNTINLVGCVYRYVHAKQRRGMLSGLDSFRIIR